MCGRIGDQSFGHRAAQSTSTTVFSYEQPTNLAGHFTLQLAKVPKAHATKSLTGFVACKQQESWRFVDRGELNELVVHVVESRADVGAVQQPLDTPPILREQPADDEAFGVIGHSGDPGHGDHAIPLLCGELVPWHLWHS